MISRTDPGRPGGGKDVVEIVQYAVLTVLPFWATWKLLDWILGQARRFSRRPCEPEFAIIEIEQESYLRKAE